jgi:hypothetical protein
MTPEQRLYVAALEALMDAVSEAIVLARKRPPEKAVLSAFTVACVSAARGLRLASGIKYDA